jgi:hypothetical protein
VPWVDAILVSAGKLRKLSGSLSELRSSVSERLLESTFPMPVLFACQNCAVYSVFASGMTSQNKISQFLVECMERLTVWT